MHRPRTTNRQQHLQLTIIMIVQIHTTRYSNQFTFKQKKINNNIKLSNAKRKFKTETNNKINIIK